MAFQRTRSSRRLKNNHQDDQQKQPFFSKASENIQTKSDQAFFQPKLTIGQPGDKYEKEADAVADSIVNKGNAQPAIQQKEISSIQRATLSTPVEEEKLSTAESKMEEDKLIQEKPEIQKMDHEEEDTVQMQGEEEEEALQMQEEEEEVMQTKSATPNTATPQMSQKIKSKSGGGQKLSPKVKTEMESGIGVDFSRVNIHTDQDAIQMNKALKAQAFTHGEDIYFNSGKYNPETSEGKHLLAHELTHVVQQQGGDVKKKEANSHISLKPEMGDPIHDPLLDEYSKVTGLPRDQVSQHDPNFKRWLMYIAGIENAPYKVSFVHSAPPAAVDHTQSNPGPNNSGAQRAGYSSMNLKPNMTVDWRDKKIDNQYSNLFVESANIQFTLSNPKVYVSSDYSVNSCPYKVTEAHEYRHISNFIDIFNRHRNTMVAEVNVIPLPTSSNPVKVKTADLGIEQAKIIKPVVDAIIKVQRKIKKEMMDDRHRMDAPGAYAKEYKKCPAADWNP